MMEKKDKQMLFYLGLMGFFTNGDIYSGAPLIVKIAEDLSITVSNAALSVTAYMLAFGLFTLILGPMGDRYGKSRIMIISSFGTAIFSCLCIFANNLPLLIFLRAANGALAAGNMPISMAIVGEKFQGEQLQGAVGKLMGWMLLGGAFATIIGGAISYIASWKGVYLAYGVAELIISFLLLNTLEPSKRTIKKLNYFDIYGKAIANGKLMSVVLLIIVSGFAVFGSFTYTGELVSKHTDLNILSIGFVLAFFGIGGIAGSNVIEKIRMKIGNNVCIVAGVIGSIALFQLSHISYYPLISLLLFFVGVMFVFVHSANLIMAQSIIPNMRGTAMALVSFGMFCGSGIGTLVNNRILEKSVIENIFISAALIFLCLGLSTWLIHKVINHKMIQGEGRRGKPLPRKMSSPRV
jgi:predicted MFS family arabinose efflux permease